MLMNTLPTWPNEKWFLEHITSCFKKYPIEKNKQKEILDSIEEWVFSRKKLDAFFETYNISIEDRYYLLDFFSKTQEINLKKQCAKWAVAAILSRNLSHWIGRNVLSTKENPSIKEFIHFCNPNIDIQNTSWNIYRELLQQDTENIKNHPLNILYKKERESGKSVVDAIKSLPRWEEAIKNQLSWWILPSNQDILEWSKMWNTSLCMWRINTILWILILNEWVDYIDTHVSYAEVIKDWLEDILENIVPESQRDTSYLNEMLNYEDPHQTLIITDENWKEIDIDPNHIALQQIGWEKNISNIVLKYPWNISDIAYKIFYLNYINEKILQNPNDQKKEDILNCIKNFNDYVWGSEILLKRLCTHTKDRESLSENTYSKELLEFVKTHPEIKNKFYYHMRFDFDNIEKFIHKKYGPQFSVQDVFAQYGYYI